MCDCVNGVLSSSWSTHELHSLHSSTWIQKGMEASFALPPAPCVMVD